MLVKYMVFMCTLRPCFVTQQKGLDTDGSIFQMNFLFFARFDMRTKTDIERCRNMVLIRKGETFEPSG